MAARRVLQVCSHSPAHLGAAPCAPLPHTQPCAHSCTRPPHPPRLQAVEKANDLFDKYAAAAGGSGQGAAAAAEAGASSSEARVSMSDLQALMREASEVFPHLREHAIFLDGWVLLLLCWRWSMGAGTVWC